MKINILQEGFFKTPAQAKAARAAELNRSSADILAATATEALSNNTIKIINDTINRHELVLFPTDFLTSLQYYSLRKTVSANKYDPNFKMKHLTKDDLRVLKVKFDDDKLIITLNFSFPVFRDKNANGEEYEGVNIYMSYIDNHLIFTEDLIDLHKKYFLLGLKHYLEDDYANDRVDNSALKIIEYLENNKVEFDKIHLFTGHNNVYFVPEDHISVDNQFDSVGKFITTSSVKYGSWNGALSIMRFGKFLTKHFVIANTGKFGFIYTHDQQGLADMKVINSSSLKNYADNFISTFLTASNNSFKNFINHLITDGGFSKKYYRDGEFVLPRRDKEQIKKWLQARQAAVDNGLVKIEKIDREIVTLGATIDMDKVTGELSIGKDFNANKDTIRLNAIIYIKLAGIPEEIGISRIFYDNKTYTAIYCTDMGAPSLKRTTRTEDGYTREIFEFPNSNFPILYANSQFSIYMINTLLKRMYEVEHKNRNDNDKPSAVEKAGTDFTDILYLEATGEIDSLK